MAPDLTDCRRMLDAAVGGGMTEPALRVLAAAPESVVDEALRAFAAERGADALPVLSALAADRADRAVRRAAKRALYRLSQRGIVAPAPAARPVVARRPAHAIRAWVSAVDGSGSRAVWLLFEGGYGGLSLCSLILSDTVGVVETAGGEISKKRLDVELASLRQEQKLPWVETDPERAVGLVADALALHATTGTAPPATFARWRPMFEGATPVALPPLAPADPSLVERSPELLALPELAGWFLDPERVQADAVDLLQARESRLVVSDQIKAEREEAIVTAVVEREIDPEARTRWARRLREMALIFRAIQRADHAMLADAAASAFADPARETRHHPFARALARRALDVAGEVALGRVSAADVSRKPGPVTASGHAAATS